MCYAVHLIYIPTYMLFYAAKEKLQCRFSFNILELDMAAKDMQCKKKIEIIRAVYYFLYAIT